MAYADLLADETLESRFLAIVQPRRIVTGWTETSPGSHVYETTFDYGTVAGVTVDGVTFTYSSAGYAVNAGEYGLAPAVDGSTIIYVRLSGNDDPDLYTVVVTYKLYLSTEPVTWHTTPTSAATAYTEYFGIITQVPAITAQTTDSLFGYLPVQSTQLVLTNAERTLDRHFYDSSFNKAELSLYHSLGPISATNTFLIMSGLCSDVTHTDQTVSIKVVDRIDILEKEYRHSSGSQFFNTTDFPNLDPAFIGKPIRTIYGMVDGVQPVNIDYNADNPDVWDNRFWIVKSIDTGSTYSGDLKINLKLDDSGNTTTRTYLENVTGLYNVFDSGTGQGYGDTVVVETDVTGYIETIQIIEANVAGGYITHTALGSPLTSTISGNRARIRRPFVQFLSFIRQNETTAIEERYDLLPGIHWHSYYDATNKVAGFELLETVESTLSIGVNLNPSDRFVCRAYGRANDVTMSSSTFGPTVSSNYGSLDRGVVVLFDLLKRVGISESQIDLTTFTSLNSSVTTAVGFAIPGNSSGSFPTYKTLIGNLLQTLLLKLFVNNDNKWTLTSLAPLGTTDVTATRYEIIDRSFQYSFEHGDIISDVIIEYQPQEITDPLIFNSLEVRRVTATSDHAKWVHNVNKQKTFETYHLVDSEAQTYADRLAFIFGDRAGRVRLDVGREYYQTLISDVVEVSRASLPGYEFVSGTDRTRKFNVLETNKQGSRISLVLDDQKGIEDNSGGW